MRKQINLVKNNFSKTQYPKVIDTNFTQLIPISESIAQQPLPTVNEFFSYYEQLFYNIPPQGATNSHEYLIRTSTAYIGLDDIAPEIRALQAEITSLREQLLAALQDNQELSQIS